MRPCRRARCTASAADRPADGGFSLVELVVAMFVVALGLMSLVPMQLRSAQTVGFAHERQRATALANGALEQVRDAAGATSRAAVIVSGGPTTPGGAGWAAPAGETLVTTATPDPSLAVQGPTATVPAFTTRLYVTVKAGDPANAVWITAVTTWTSANAARGAQQVVLRGLLFARTT